MAWMKDHYDELKEVDITTQQVCFTEFWAKAKDGSFQWTTRPEKFYETIEDYNNGISYYQKHKDKFDDTTK
jgi:hypothetical protein